MRSPVALAVSLCLALIAPARAEPPVAPVAAAAAPLASPPAIASEAPSAGRPAIWYGGWSLIVGGGALALTGVALSTRSDTDAAGQPTPGLSGTATAGWTLVAIGTAAWVSGAVALLLTGRNAKRSPSTAVRPTSLLTVRF